MVVAERSSAAVVTSIETVWMSPDPSRGAPPRSRGVYRARAAVVTVLLLPGPVATSCRLALRTEPAVAGVQAIELGRGHTPGGGSGAASGTTDDTAAADATASSAVVRPSVTICIAQCHYS